MSDETTKNRARQLWLDNTNVPNCSQILQSNYRLVKKLSYFYLKSTLVLKNCVFLAQLNSAVRCFC